MPDSGLIVWVEGPPEAVIDGDGVRLVYRSGQVEFTTRMSRNSFRRSLDAGLRMLNEWENTSNVSPFCNPCFRQMG